METKYCYFFENEENMRGNVWKSTKKNISWPHWRNMKVLCDYKQTRKERIK